MKNTNNYDLKKPYENSLYEDYREAAGEDLDDFIFSCFFENKTHSEK